MILHNECIILPGLGGFETEYLPARLDNNTGLMLPPSKKVFFKTEYTSGGEILKNSLIKQLGLKDDEAETIIKGYVTEIKSKLSKGEIVKVGDIGSLSLGLSGALHFTVNKEENYLADSFGLEPLPVKTRKKTQPKKIENRPELKITERSNTLTFIIVGVLLISILLAATIIISARYNFYLFNIGNKQADSEMLIFGGSDTSDSYSAKIQDKIDESTLIKNALSYTGNKAVKPQTDTITVQHLIIAGSFKDMENATALEKKLINEGYKPKIVKADGFYRVYIGVFSDKTDALKELERVRRQMTRSVWLMSVKGI